ncbi:MAG: hydrogenase small subunit [Chloroflexi bacterium]|nr:hydrogenase small subunit [Chloroflexota bacterium]
MKAGTIYDELARGGISRREFMKICGLLAGALGLTSVPPVDVNAAYDALRKPDGLVNLVAEALQTKPRLPVIWLEFQDCAGCTEALTRSHDPTLVNLVLNTIDIEYHETLFAAAGAQAEAAKEAAIKKYAGQYVLVVEGSISPGSGQIYCTIGGRGSGDLLQEAAANAFAVVATGNCATFGGLPRANPDPTGAVGVMDLVTDKPVINVPGCPAIPEVFTGTLFHLLVFGAPPELDSLKRPMPFYANTIHDRCLRRPYYEAGLFADSFDDDGARKGYCLYKLGCKGPTTYNSCATIKWMEGLSFPIQAGHPCLGCSEPNFWDGGGFYQGQSAPLLRPAAALAAGAGAVGLVLGAGMATANQAQKKRAHPTEQHKE